MKALTSGLLKEILLDKTSTMQLRVALHEYLKGTDKFNLVHKGQLYKVTLVKTPSEA